MFELNTEQNIPKHKNTTLNVYNETGKWGNGKDELIEIESSQYTGEKWFYKIIKLGKVPDNIENLKNKYTSKGTLEDISEDKIKSFDDYLKIIGKSN